MIRIAIDGPGGAGKSTIAKEIAKRLGIIYVDTGALYRAIGLYCLRNGVNSKNAQDVIGVLPKIHLELRYTEEGQNVLLNDENVSGEIRLPEVAMYASDVRALQDRGITVFAACADQLHLQWLTNSGVYAVCSPLNGPLIGEEELIRESLLRERE